eukprot:COSAG02_NODE_4298_length_5534_cov_111.640662_4_plen_292_part_00
MFRSCYICYSKFLLSAGAGVNDEPEAAGLGDMMRGGLSAFRARSKQLSATLEASVAQLSSPPSTSDALDTGLQEQAAPGVVPTLAEPEPEDGSDDEASTELDAAAGALMSPGPTAFGLRKVGNRSDPWCLSAISEESYGTASEFEHDELDDAKENGSKSKAGTDNGNGDATCSSGVELEDTPCPREETVDARFWHSVIWTDNSTQNLARLASFDGRAALLRCLRDAAKSHPEPTPLAPEIWWRLGDLLGLGLSAAIDSGEMELAVDLLVRRTCHLQEHYCTATCISSVATL